MLDVVSYLELASTVAQSAITCSADSRRSLIDLPSFDRHLPQLVISSPSHLFLVSQKTQELDVSTSLPMARLSGHHFSTEHAFIIYFSTIHMCHRQVR